VIKSQSAGRAESFFLAVTVSMLFVLRLGFAFSVGIRYERRRHANHANRRHEHQRGPQAQTQERRKTLTEAVRSESGDPAD
jgi:hypothetical protein